MLATTVNLPARRAPSPQIRARDTSLDGTTNSSAGLNSAPNVDAGINGATHLSGQRCRDHEDRGDSTDYRKLAEHENWSAAGAIMAATNKSLAQSNKSRSGATRLIPILRLSDRLLPSRVARWT